MLKKRFQSVSVANLLGFISRPFGRNIRYNAIFLCVACHSFVVLQKAGNHMEHTFLASYVSLLIGNLTIKSKPYELEVRNILRNQSFVDMVQILEKYYNFLNLTASVSVNLSTHCQASYSNSESSWF